MYRTPKPNQHVSDELPEFDVDALLAKTGVILQREIRSLLAASARGKLDRADSQDLIAYVKLLADTKTQLEEATRSMTDEELRKIK